MLDIFPPVQVLLEMYTEEIGPILLKYLIALESESTSSNLNRYNFTLDSNPALREYAQNEVDKVARVLNEAWIWLEKEGFLAPLPNQTGEFAYITRKGKLQKDNSDFSSYRHADLLPTGNLDAQLAQKVKSLFAKGDYDDAVFQAYKEVEIRIRKIGGYADSMLGVDLARKAFHPDTGPLTDKSKVKSEQESMMHLFSGALGSFKNPGSHREVEFDNPAEVSEIILFANYLLRVVDSRKTEASIERMEAEQAVRPASNN